jgi:4-hydroxy-2-oxoheptanedioate aldolase
VSYDIPGSGAAALGSGLRRIVDERRVTHGGWCTIPSAFSAEVVSATGCDWLCIDLQHGLIDDAAMRLMVMAAAIRRTPTLVRVTWSEPAAIMRALDAGADGVIVPMVNTAEEARAAVAPMRYPPHGYRSWGPIRSTMAQPGFGTATGNAQVVCIVMIETVEAVANLESILAVEGVDGVFVGPNDLAISHSGTTSSAAVGEHDVALIREIADACRNRGLPAGITVADGPDAIRCEGFGYTLLSLPADAALIGRGMTDILGHARGERG